MRRGELTVECENKGCYAEQTFRFEDAESETFISLMRRAGWRLVHGLDICPECVMEAAERQEREADAVAG